MKIKQTNGKWKVFEVNETGRIICHSATWYGYIKPIDGPRQERALLPDRQGSELMLASLRRAAMRGGVKAIQEQTEPEPTLADLAATWLESLKAAGKNAGHVRTEKARLSKALKDCGLKVIADLTRGDLADKFAEFQESLAKPKKLVKLGNGDEFAPREIAALLGISGTALGKLAHARGVTGNGETGKDKRYNRAEALRLIEHRGRGLSPRTLNGYKITLTTFCGWLVKRRKIQRVPFLADGLDSRKDTRRQRRAISAEDLGRLVSSVRISGKKIGGMSAAVRAVAYELAFYTLARARAIREARAEDFSLEGATPTFSIRAEADKTRKARQVPMPKWLADNLRPILTTSKKTLFPLPDGMGTIMRADLRAAGVPWETGEGVCDFHALRHSGCTNFLRAGVNPLTVAKLAGWSDTKMILSRYGHLIASDLAAALGQAFEAGAGAKTDRR